MIVRAWVKLVGCDAGHDFEINEEIEVDPSEVAGSDGEIDPEKLEAYVKEWRDEHIEWSYKVIHMAKGGD